MQTTMVNILKHAQWSSSTWEYLIKDIQNISFCRYPGSLKVPGVEDQNLEALRTANVELSILPNADKPSKPLKQT